MKQYLRALTEFQTYVTASYQDAEQVLRGETIENLFGMNWHFVAGRYKDSAGTNIPTMDPKKLIFIPPVSEGFVQASNGKVLRPDDPRPARRPAGGSGLLAENYGVVLPTPRSLQPGRHRSLRRRLLRAELRHSQLDLAGHRSCLDRPSPGRFWLAALPGRPEVSPLRPDALLPTVGRPVLLGGPMYSASNTYASVAAVEARPHRVRRHVGRRPG